MAKTNKKFVILDAHAILHRSFHALPSFSSPKGEPTGALYGYSAFLLKALRELKPDYIAAAYDLPEPTFRHIAYEKYKGTRQKIESDLANQIERSYDITKVFAIPIFEHKKFEADDMIGSLVEISKSKKDLDIIIASGDLDTLQLVEKTHVKVYTLRKGLQDTIVYDEAKVKERYGFHPKFLADFKGLKGDPSDNIIGVPGIGEKTAAELIQKFGTLEKIFKALKKDKKGMLASGIKERTLKLLEEHEEEALFSKALAEIRRDAPLEFSFDRLDWKKYFKKEEAAKLFKELGFASLISRLPEESEARRELPEIKTEADSKFLEDSENIFWHFSETDRKLYAVSAEKKISEFSLDGDTANVEKVLNLKKNHIFFDAKKILHLLRPVGINPEVHFDLKIAAWLARPSLQNPSLLETIHNYLPKIFFSEGDMLRMAQTMPDIYAALARELKEKKLEKVYGEIELPLIKVLFGMEARGILTDTELLKKLSKESSEKIIDLSSKIYELSGIEFNISSPKQLGEILFERIGLQAKGLKKTAKGSRSTRESELFKLKNAHPIIELILAHRELSKLKSTYIDAIPKLADKDERVHTTFDQTGTVTGRLSSLEPNLQNIPIRSEEGRKIRKAFRAAPGFELVAFDYSQLELRIAAILARDKKMLEAFKTGKDIHAITAAEIFNVPEDRVTEQMRRKAKVINFGILYGMGINALAEGMGVPRDEAERFWNEYFRDFEGVSKFIADTKKMAHEKGYVETVFGRRRYLPELSSAAEYIRKEAERMAVNAPIQGTEADVAKLGMIRAGEMIEDKFKGSAYLLLQIHDELLFEVKQQNISAFIPPTKEILESVYKNEITLAVDIKTGVNWGEMQKYKQA
ncbi:DNA polymerase I [Candidatus Giovannonibacteria bacterium]|nr:DNA polymerase I [Candidatus Giovannonibacteria bacterium]